ncbi:MAG: ABC transporter ATP-binding protein [Prevotellaceae bacterium]|nr:ABC transporter ATP-binding protein [Prevotellaceae bacterium]
MKLNKTRYSTVQIAAWLWKHHKRCRLQAMLNMAIGLLQVVLGLLGVDTIRSLTDIATHSKDGSIVWGAILLALILLIELLLHIASTWIGAVLGVKTQNITQRHFFNRLLKGEWRGIEKYHSGDVLNRLFGDVSDIVSLMTDVLPSLVIIIVQFVASFIYLYIMDSTLAVIVIISSPFFILLSRIYFKKMRRIVRKIKDSNSAIQSIIQECIQHKMVIKVLWRENTMVSKLEHRQTVLHKQIKTRAKFSILSKSLVNIGFAGAYLTALSWGLMQLDKGLITVGVLMAFTQLINRIQRPMLDIARLLPVFVNSMTSCERLMELEELPLEDMALPVHLHGDIGISFKNVSYKYTDKGRTILRNFSHDFKPRSFTAILGETGAGKTTLIRMILALIKPSEGDVKAYNSQSDGTAPIATETPISPSLRCNFSYIPQGNTLFSGTIRENLLLGNPNATTEQMKEALHLAMADFVLDMPNGLDTKCSEQGGGLSEGQAQRIAIARAILHPCKVLLLDEATSALDIDTERHLLTNLKQHFEDCTIIFVTHRLAVVDFTSDVLKMTSTKALSTPQ